MEGEAFPVAFGSPDKDRRYQGPYVPDSTALRLAS